MKTRHWPRAIAVLVATSLLLAACGKDDKPKVAGGTSTTSTIADAQPGVDPADPATDPASGAPPASVAGGTAGSGGKATTTTAKPAAGKSGSGQATTATTLESDLGTPQDPGAMLLPKEGSYSYTVFRGKANTAPEKSRNKFLLKIENVGPSKGPFRHIYSITGDTGGKSDQHFIFKASTIDWDKQIDKGSACDWTPDNLHMERPLTIGSTWSSTSSCTTQAAQVTITRKLTSTDKVTRLGRVKVGDTVVDCKVIERATTLETNYLVDGKNRSSRSEITETEWVAAKLGLVVREAITTKFTSDENKTESHTFERTIDKLTPA